MNYLSFLYTVIEESYVNLVFVLILFIVSHDEIMNFLNFFINLYMYMYIFLGHKKKNHSIEY